MFGTENLLAELAICLPFLASALVVAVLVRVVEADRAADENEHQFRNHHTKEKAMTLEDAKKIVEAAERDGVDLQIREGYAGRGMRDETTVGVVGNYRLIVGYAKVAGLNPNGFQWDSMGFKSIVY